jgi:hypothetical protein
MAQSGRAVLLSSCLLLEVKQPRLRLDRVAANDPKRAFASFTGTLSPVAGLNFGNCLVSSADCTFIPLDVKAIMTRVWVTAEWGEVVGTKVFISYSSKDSKFARQAEMSPEQIAEAQPQHQKSSGWRQRLLRLLLPRT